VRETQCDIRYVNMQLPAHTNLSDSLPQRGVPAFGLINGQLASVRELINERLAGCSVPVVRLLEHLNICGGKMIRPGLVLLAGSACGKITEKHIQIAAIVEIIHNATLLHDDVMDGGQKRRGQPTVNSLWGNESAVLLGDFLLSKVFEMCVDLEPRVIGIIADIAVRTCEGELKQVIQRQNWQLSESEYIDIITEKSAVFFSRACLLGAVLAGTSEMLAQSLAHFGRDIGIAFQITDDLLDMIGDESKTGKTLGSDVDKNKLTLATIHLLSDVDESEKSVVIRKLNSAPNHKEELVEMLRSHGSLKYARNRAKEFVARANQALVCLEESDAKDALMETAGFVADRAL